MWFNIDISFSASTFLCCLLHRMLQASRWKIFLRRTKSSSWVTILPFVLFWLRKLLMFTPLFMWNMHGWLFWGTFYYFNFLFLLFFLFFVFGLGWGFSGIFLLLFFCGGKSLVNLHKDFWILAVFLVFYCLFRCGFMGVFWVFWFFFYFSRRFSFIPSSFLVG